MKVTGTISDRANGDTIVGAVVFQSDANGKPSVNGKSTISGLDGNYSIDIPENSFLTARMVSYIPQTINVGKSKDIDFGMKQDVSSQLQEVVVEAKGGKKPSYAGLYVGLGLLLLVTGFSLTK